MWLIGEREDLNEGFRGQEVGTSGKAKRASKTGVEGNLTRVVLAVKN